MLSNGCSSNTRNPWNIIKIRHFMLHVCTSRKEVLTTFTCIGLLTEEAHSRWMWYKLTQTELNMEFKKSWHHSCRLLVSYKCPELKLPTFLKDLRKLAVDRHFSLAALLGKCILLTANSACSITVYHLVSLKFLCPWHSHWWVVVRWMLDQ